MNTMFTGNTPVGLTIWCVLFCSFLTDSKPVKNNKNISGLARVRAQLGEPLSGSTRKSLPGPMEAVFTERRGNGQFEAIPSSTNYVRPVPSTIQGEAFLGTSLGTLSPFLLSIGSGRVERGGAAEVFHGLSLGILRLAPSSLTGSGRGPSKDQGEVAQGFRGTSLGTLAPPTSAAAPLSTHLSGAGGTFSDAGGLPKVDGSLSLTSLTVSTSSLSCSICCFVGWEVSSPFFFQKPFSFPFSFYFSQKTQNSVSQEETQKTAFLRNIPPYGSPNPPRRQVQKVPLRRKNRVPLLPLRYSAKSAYTLLSPFSGCARNVNGEIRIYPCAKFFFL